MTRERCQECGTPPEADGRPGCACVPHPVGATTAPLPRPLGPPSSGPAPEDLGLFGAGHEPPGDRAGDGDAHSRRSTARHRRRTRRPAAGLAIAAVAAAVDAVITGMQLLSGTDDDAAPPPDDRLAPTLALPTGDGSADTDESADPSRSASTVASPRPSSSAPSSSAAAQPTTTAPDPPPTTSSSPPSRAADRLVLREGSSGAEVRELQARLKQVRGYGPKVDGKYDGSVRDVVRRFQRSNNVTGDTPGVYGPATRRALESVTTEP